MSTVLLFALSGLSIQHAHACMDSKNKCCYDLKYAVSVECCTQRCYFDLVRNVVYDNFQDILVHA